MPADQPRPTPARHPGPARRANRPWRMSPAAARKQGSARRCARRRSTTQQQPATEVRRPEPPATTSGSQGRHPRREQQEHQKPEPQLHESPSGALPGDGPQAPADIPTALPWRTARSTSPTTPPGITVFRSCNPVVRCRRGAERDGHPEAAGDEPPSPGLVHRGDEPDAGRQRQGPAVDRIRARPGTGRFPAATRATATIAAPPSQPRDLPTPFQLPSVGGVSCHPRRLAENAGHPLGGRRHPSRTRSIDAPALRARRLLAEFRIGQPAGAAQRPTRRCLRAAPAGPVGAHRASGPAPPAARPRPW